MPEVKESREIVPTSSTPHNLRSRALVIAAMKYKKFGKLDFKKIHPAGSLGAKLQTVGDLMLTGNKIPFINQNVKIINALKILTKKKLGVLIIQNKTKKTIGIVTDGQIRRYSEKNIDIKKMRINEIMTKNPIGIDKNSLAAKALALMNSKRITSLCVYDKKKRNKTIGILHIHNILQNNIS